MKNDELEKKGSSGAPGFSGIQRFMRAFVWMSLVSHLGKNIGHDTILMI